MEITKDISKQLVYLFRNIKSPEKHQISNGEDYYNIYLDKSNDTLYIQVKKDTSLKQLADFMNKIDDEVWLDIMNKFEDYTGYSVNQIDGLFKQHDYNSVLSLLKDVTNQVVEDTLKLYTNQQKKLK